MNEKVKVFWLDFNGKEVLYNTLRPGSNYTQQTYIDHVWLIRGADDRKIMKWSALEGAIVDVCIIEGTTVPTRDEAKETKKPDHPFGPPPPRHAHCSIMAEFDHPCDDLW